VAHRLLFGPRMNPNRLLCLAPMLILTAACGAEPSPVVVGNISTQTMRQALSAASHDDDEGFEGDARFQLDIEINGDPRAVALDVDGAFAVQELPTGQLHFAVAIEGIRGTLELDDVQPGEVIEIGVSAAPGALELRVVRRDAQLAPEDAPVTQTGDIEIHGKDIVHHLPHGRIEGDIIIHGHDVTVVGPDYYECREGGRTVVDGRLIVHGKDVRVINVEFLRGTQIHGHDVKVYEPCRRRYGRD
jgi:hypothetical protein